MEILPTFDHGYGSLSYSGEYLIMMNKISILDATEWLLFLKSLPHFVFHHTNFLMEHRSTKIRPQQIATTVISTDKTDIIKTLAKVLFALFRLFTMKCLLNTGFKKNFYFNLFYFVLQVHYWISWVVTPTDKNIFTTYYFGSGTNINMLLQMKSKTS